MARGFVVGGALALLLALCPASFAQRAKVHQGKTARAWAALLKSEDVAQRREAVLAFGQLEHRSATTARTLGELLTQDADEDVRLNVTLVLTNVDDGPRTVRALVHALQKDASAAVRAGAAEALGLLGERAAAAVPALIQALRKDASDHVRDCAASAFSSLDGLGEPATPHLLRLARDERSKPGLRSSALFSLGYLRPRGETLDGLIALAQADPSAEVRRAALEALGGVGPDDAKRVVPILARCVGARDRTIRVGAVMGLQRVRPGAARAAVPALVQALADPKLRSLVAQTLGSLGAAARPAVPKLLELLGPKRTPIDHTVAVIALRGVGPAAEAAVPRLSALLEGSPRASLRQSAAAALREVRKGTGRPVPALSKAARADADARTRALACQGLGAIGGEGAAGTLTAALKDPSPVVRSQAAFGLGLLKTRAASGALLGALRDPHAAVRSYAAEALGGTGDARKPVVAGLLAACRDAEPGVRAHAARSLGRLGAQGKEVRRTLDRLVGAKQPHVRLAAAEANLELGRPDAVGLHVLILLLRAKRPAVRMRAVMALERLRPQKVAAVRALSRVVQQDAHSGTRSTACQALAKLGPKLAQEAVPVLERAAARDASYDVRDDAAAALQILRR